MADASKPKGKPRGRNGGRPAGTQSVLTIAAAKEAQATMEAAQRRGKKLAIDVLDDFMGLFAGMAAYYQPTPDGTVRPGTKPNETQFEKYARLTIKVAGELAPYQSATYRAILAAAPAPKTDPSQLKRRFTLLAFDNARPQKVADDAKVIEGKAVKPKKTVKGAMP